MGYLGGWHGQQCHPLPLLQPLPPLPPPYARPPSILSSTTAHHLSLQVDNTTGAWVPEKCRSSACLAVFGVIVNVRRAGRVGLDWGGLGSRVACLVEPPRFELVMP